MSKSVHDVGQTTYVNLHIRVCSLSTSSSSRACNESDASYCSLVREERAVQAF